MDKKLGLSIVVCVAISGAILVGYTSARLAAQDVQFIPTPEGAIVMPPCEEPTWIVGEQQVCRFLVTPFVPSERSQRQSHYTVMEDIPNQDLEPGQSIRDIPVRKLYVQNTVTGQQVRLGDDAGDTFFQVMTDQYVIWRYLWNGWAETTTKTGLYAYVLAYNQPVR